MSAMSTSTPPQVVGNRFFGPDFNIDQIKGKTFNSQFAQKQFHHCPFYLFPDLNTNDTNERSPRTPRTPIQSGCSSSCPGARSNQSGDVAAEKGHRKTLEQRRQLVMELFNKCGMFPSSKDTTEFQVNKTTECYLIEIVAFILFIKI